MLERRIGRALARASLGQSQAEAAPAQVRPAVKFGLALGTIVAIMAAIEFVDLPADTRLWKEVQNAGHMPLFAILASALLVASIQIFGEKLGHRYRHYLLALAASVVLGIVTEWLQIYTGRDADPYDVLRDIAGAASCLGFLVLLDASMLSVWQLRIRAVRRGLATASAMLLLAPLTPLGFWVVAYASRDLAFPEIVSFSSFWQRQFVVTQNATLRVANAPKEWGALAGKRVGKFTLRPAAYTGFWVQEPYPDWRGYHFLAMAVYLDTDGPVELTLSVQDRQHNYEFSDRFTEHISLLRGPNELLISLDKIRRAPAHRELDLENVAAIALLARSPTKPYSISVSDVHLQ